MRIHKLKPDSFYTTFTFIYESSKFIYPPLRLHPHQILFSGALMYGGDHARDTWPAEGTAGAEWVEKTRVSGPP